MQAHKSTLFPACSRAHLITNRKQAPEGNHYKYTTLLPDKLAQWPDLLLLPLPGEVQQQFVVDVLLSLVRLRHLRLSSDKSTCSDVRKTLLEGVHSLDWFSAQMPKDPATGQCVQHASSSLAHVLPTGSTGILTVDWSTFSIYGNIPHWLRAQLLTVGVANLCMLIN